MNIEKKRKSWSHINTIDDFNKFIEREKIINTVDFKNRFSYGYEKVKTLGITKDIIYYKKPMLDDNTLYTLTDFNNFIKQHYITDSENFNKRFNNEYKRSIELGIAENLIYCPKIKNWEFLNTIEDFNNFIIQNNITSPKDFIDKFRGGYDKASRLKFTKDLSYKTKLRNWSHLNTIEDFNNFIIQNNIISPIEFEKRFSSVYNRARRLGIVKNLIFEHKQNNWKNINSVNDFNKFIKKNNIINSVDFQNRFCAGWQKAIRLKITKKFIYCKIQFKSSWEKYLYDIIDNDQDFSNLEKEVVFEDCKNKKELPFDLMFSFSKKPNIKIIIEIQGPTHYAAIYKSEKKYISTRKNDIIKNKWAREKEDIYLFYYSELNEHLNDNCYPYYIYTSIKELLNDIKKLI